MNLRPLAILACLALLPLRSTGAQSPALRPALSRLFITTAASAPAPDTLNLPNTYWKEGAVITGVPTGLLFAAFVHGFCTDSEVGSRQNCTLKAIVGGLFGFALGAVPGALIGGQFEKPH